MPSKPFGKHSLELLQTVPPDLRKFAEKVNEGWQCTILSGSRTMAQQADFVNGTNFTGINPDKEVRSKTMHSDHLVHSDGFGYAIDMAPDPVNFDKPGYKLDLIYFAGYAMRIAEEMGLNIEYGGDWDHDQEISDESFQDTDHFALKK